MEAVFIDKHYQLVTECKQGSRKACYELYRLYSKAMLNIAFRVVGNTGDAEDILQEAFLDAFNKIQDFRQETTFGSWLKQIVVNKSVNLLRKRKIEWAEFDDNHLDTIADEPDEDDEEIQYEVMKVKEAIKLLPDG